jgi:hypothetical protein
MTMKHKKSTLVALYMGAVVTMFIIGRYQGTMIQQVAPGRAG